MGYGVPAALAAALTTGRAVVTLTGDGDFVMSMGELATAGPTCTTRISRRWPRPSGSPVRA